MEVTQHIPTLLNCLTNSKNKNYIHQLRWLNDEYIQNWIIQYVVTESNFININSTYFSNFILTLLESCIKNALHGQTYLILKGDYSGIYQSFNLSISQTELIIKDFFTHLGFDIKDTNSNLTIDWKNI